MSLQPLLELQCFNKVNAFDALGIAAQNGWYNSVYPNSVTDDSVCIESKDCCQTNIKTLFKAKNLSV